MAKMSANVHTVYAPSMITVLALITALKMLLFYSYHSTDFEVHRNWLSVTGSLPLNEWYVNDTSQWTLDYPPLFAYFEYLLSVPARAVDKNMLNVQSEPYLNKATLMYQRATVILSDLFYAACVYRLLKSPSIKQKVEKEGVTLPRVRTGWVLLVCNPALLLLDNIHFQYNSWLTGWLLLSLVNVLERRYLAAAVYFCVLVNLKHIYLYYAPAYAAIYLAVYCFHGDRPWLPNLVAKVAWTKCVSLAAAIGAVFACSLGPFIGQLDMVVKRLFPVQRGLTHAYWAPNIWALYNIIDMVAYRLAKISGRADGLNPPIYTNGLVQQYEHSVLPNVTPAMATAATLAFILLLMYSADASNFVQVLSLCGFTCYMFGWHVHEKAIILVTIPACLLVITNRKYLAWFIVLTWTAHTSLMPLFFTAFELPTKLMFAGVYALLTWLTLTKQYHVQPEVTLLNVFQRLYVFGLVAVVGYSEFLHERLVGDRLPFFKHGVVSVYCTLGTLYCYIWLYIETVLCDRWQLHMRWYKTRYERLVQSVTQRTPFSAVDRQPWQIQWPKNESELKLVAGLDISTMVHDTSQAAVAISIHRYPDMTLVSSMVRQVYCPQPYIPGYLAAREAAPMCTLYNQFVAAHPELTPQLILVDGNGRLHPKGFGLACMVGVTLDVPTVGVAKNLHHIELIDTQKTLSACKALRGRGNSVAITNSSTGELMGTAVCLSDCSAQPAYISVGHAISDKTAVEAVLNCSKHKLPEPIRQADAISREAIRQWSQ